MKIPVNNTPELAQWYLEKGREEEGGGWGFIVILLLITPLCPVIPLYILYASIFIWPQGRRMRKLGEAMNEAAGRENYERPRGYAGTRFMRGWEAKGDNPRYYPVSTHPPVEPVWA